jgi:uncharacterized lipoprotein YajG
MQIRSCSIAAALAALFLLAACQTMGTREDLTTAAPAQQTAALKPAPAYYYYLAAQQTLKKGDVNEAV